MWSVHVIPNNGTSCLALEEQYQTHVMVRKKNAREGGGGLAKHFSSKNAPFYECYENKLFSDHLFLSSCCFCLFLSIHCLFDGLESLLQETCYHF